MGIGLWLAEHWFSLLQSAGIIGSLIFTGASLRIDARARRTSNLIAISRQHRDIWTEILRRPDLLRILSPRGRVETAKISESEEAFVTLLIHHLASAYDGIRFGLITELDGLQRDVAQFFALPIPRKVWERIRPYQNMEFVRFMDHTIGPPTEPR